MKIARRGELCTCAGLPPPGPVPSPGPLCRPGWRACLTVGSIWKLCADIELPPGVRSLHVPEEEEEQEAQTAEGERWEESGLAALPI